MVGNLGHGMLPGHDAVALGEFFSAIGEVSAALSAGGEGGEAAAAGEEWLQGRMREYYSAQGQ